jgi:hypothetical protein
MCNLYYKYDLKFKFFGIKNILLLFIFIAHFFLSLDTKLIPHNKHQI